MSTEIIDPSKAEVHVNGIKIADIIDVTITPTLRRKSFGEEWDGLSEKACYACGGHNLHGDSWEVEYYPNGFAHIQPREVKLQFKCFDCGCEYNLRYFR